MQAIVSTIRDVMQYNTLFAQQLGLTANPSKNVVDNPIYLCDLVGSLVSADPSDLQNLMDEEVVSCFELTYSVRTLCLCGSCKL